MAYPFAGTEQEQAPWELYPQEANTSPVPDDLFTSMLQGDGTSDLVNRHPTAELGANDRQGVDPALLNDGVNRNAETPWNQSPHQVQPGIDPSLTRPVQSVSSGSSGSRFTQKQAAPTAEPAIPSASEMQANVKPAYDEQRAALADQAAGLAGVDEVTGRYAGLSQDTMVEAQVQRHSELKQQAESMAAANEEVAKSWAAVKDVDPNKLWHDNSNFGKASGMVAAFIGGFLAPYNGGKNMPLETMMQMVDQDIHAQQANQENDRSKAYAAGRRQETLGVAQDRTLKSMDFERATRLEALAKGAESEAAKYQSEITKGKLLQAAAQIREEEGKSLNAYHQTVVAEKQHQADKAQEAANNAANRSLERWQTNQRMALEREQAAGKAGANQPADTTLARSPFNQHDVEIAPDVAAGMSKEQRTKVQTEYGINTQRLQAGQEYLRMRAKVGRKLAPGIGMRGLSQDDPDVQRMNSAYTALMWAVQHDSTGAAATGKEAGYAAKIVGAPNGLLDADSIAATQQFVKERTQERQNMHTQFKIYDKTAGPYDPNKTKPVDAFDETKTAPDVDVGRSSNPLKEARESWKAVSTNSDPKTVVDNLDAMTDFLNGGQHGDLAGATRGLLHGIISGSVESKKRGTVDTTSTKFDAKSRVEAVSRVRAAAARAASIAHDNGDSDGAREALAAGERLVEALKGPGSAEAAQTADIDAIRRDMAGAFGGFADQANAPR